MTKKQILICAIVVALYLLSFYLAKTYLKVETYNNAVAEPFVILPRCAKDAVAIGITSEHDTICQGKNGISRYATEKEVVILPITDIAKDTLVISRLNYLLLISEQKVVFKEILSNLTLVDRGTIELAKNESFIDVFLSSDTSEDILLLSTELKAQSPTDDKSKIRILSISHKDAASNVNSIYEIRSKYIDSVLYANFSVTKPFIITHTAYPFLELRYRVLHQVEQRIEDVTTCTITEILPGYNQPLWEQQCSDKPTREISSTNEQLSSNTTAIELLKKRNAILFENSYLLITADRKLIWKNMELTKHLLDNISATIDTFSIISQQSTRIGKRVYNCIDFGDSPQISLRVCIPFYD